MYLDMNFFQIKCFYFFFLFYLIICSLKNYSYFLYFGLGVGIDNSVARKSIRVNEVFQNSRAAKIRSLEVKVKNLLSYLLEVVSFIHLSQHQLAALC